jgi:hypothetical protein
MELKLHFLVPHLIRQLLCDADLAPALNVLPINIGKRMSPAPGPIARRAFLQQRQGSGTQILPGCTVFSLVLGLVFPIVSMSGRAQLPATSSRTVATAFCIEA